jgi:hypothetical protein
MIEMSYGAGEQKTHRYGELLRRFMTDQLDWIHDRGHIRRVTEQNGRESLQMAARADVLARS